MKKNNIKLSTNSGERQITNCIQGKIIKGIAGFYYVHVVGAGLYECKAKGAFRNDKVKPLVGDDVEIMVLDESHKKGNIREIIPRQNSLIRPAVANVDQAIVFFALSYPAPNYNLLDRFLILMARRGVQTVICFNKLDLVGTKVVEEARTIYNKSGCTTFFVSAKTGEGLDLLRKAMEGKMSTVAGPSGVGKSSIINLLQGNVEMETGEISQKIQRGKHTTRHSEVILVDDGTYIVDTPGFSTLIIDQMEAEEVKTYYKEFEEYEPYCKFGGCNHIKESKCGVQDAVREGQINQSRYDSYCQIYEEIKSIKKY